MFHEFNQKMVIVFWLGKHGRGRGAGKTSHGGHRGHGENVIKEEKWGGKVRRYKGLVGKYPYADFYHEAGGLGVFRRINS